MITQQSFMFLSSYEKLRGGLRARFAIETMAHVGPRAFAEISGEKVNTTVRVARQPDATCVRATWAPTSGWSSWRGGRQAASI